MEHQYVEAHIPNRTSAFVIELITTAIQVTNFVKRIAGVFAVCFTSVTIAITVVTGVMKRNQRVNTSARFNGNQWGIRRSIGKASRKTKSPSKEGKQHRNGNQFLLALRGITSDFVTVAASIETF
jgi:hypothetical protein